MKIGLSQDELENRAAIVANVLASKIAAAYVTEDAPCESFITAATSLVEEVFGPFVVSDEDNNPKEKP